MTDAPVDDAELQQVRERHPALDISREGPGRYVAADGYGREVVGRSAAELGVLLDEKVLL